DVVVVRRPPARQVAGVAGGAVQDGAGGGDVADEVRFGRPDQGHHTGGVRCGHRRAARGGVPVGRDRAAHGHARGGDVRLDPTVDTGRASAGERGDVVVDVVGADPVRLRVVARGGGAAAGRAGVAV